MAENKGIGYQDTPIIPGTKWHVHDGERPQPPVVTPGTFSEGATPPSDAIVLFDGSNLDGWEAVKEAGPAGWKLENGYMEVVPKTGNIKTKALLGDCQLHLEYMCPAAIEGASQGRGNSGVFFHAKYEIQVLDCYDNLTYPDGTTGAIYGMFPPLVNACRKPGEWNCYDIIWEAPRFKSGQVVKKAYATVLLNGLLLHNRVELRSHTGHRNIYEYEEHPHEGPLMLQDHNNPTRFRNIWYRPLKSYDGEEM